MEIDGKGGVEDRHSGRSLSAWGNELLGARFASGTHIFHVIGTRSYTFFPLSIIAAYSVVFFPQVWVLIRICSSPIFLLTPGKASHFRVMGKIVIIRKFSV